MPARKKTIQTKERKYASELLQLIPKELHDRLIEELKVDKEIRKLNGRLLFNLIFYTLLGQNEVSLRKMSHYSSSAIFHGVAGQVCERLAHNSIRRRLLQMPVDYFKKIYEHLYAEIGRHYEQRELKRKYQIKRFDSTMVHTYAYLIDGMRVGNTSKNKRQVKFSTDMTGEAQLHMKFFSDQAHVGDETTLKEVIAERASKGSEIVVFDSGLKSREVFADMDTKGILFVTRLNTDPVFEAIRPTSQTFTHTKEDIAADLPDCAPVIDDQIVHLFSARYKKVAQEFRLIRLDIGEEKPLCILTNIMDLPPEVIGAIYRCRWDIEVLFRFLKQELSLSHIISRDINAIKIMIYMTLITAMLILIYKKQNQIAGYWKAKADFLADIVEDVLFFLTADPETQLLLQEKLVKRKPHLIRKSNEHD